MEFSKASDAIAARFNRRFGKTWDGVNVRDHAYKKVSRCATIRLISRRFK